MSSPGHAQQREIIISAQKAKLHAASLILCNAKELETANSSTATYAHSTLWNKEPCMCCTLYCIYSRGMQGEHSMIWSDLIWSLRLRTLSTILPAQQLHCSESLEVVDWNLYNAGRTKTVGWLFRGGRNKVDQLPRRERQTSTQHMLQLKLLTRRVVPSTPTSVIPLQLASMELVIKPDTALSTAQAKADSNLGPRYRIAVCLKNSAKELAEKPDRSWRWPQDVHMYIVLQHAQLL